MIHLTANINVIFLFLQDKVRDPFKGPVVLPHTFGQETIILFVIEVRTIMLRAVFILLSCTQSSYHEAALKAGADIVGAEEIFNEVCNHQ